MPRQAKPLNDTQVKNAKPKDKPYELSDGGGLTLKVLSTATKSWYLKHKKVNSTKRTNFYIGEYPTITLADARKKREEIKELLAKGIDPKLHKNNELLIKSLTFKSVATDWLEIKKTAISSDHATDIRRSLEIHLYPTLGEMPFLDMKPPQAIEALTPLSIKGSHETVSRLCQRINEIMVYAVNRGLIEYNLFSGIKSAFQTPKKENMPTITAEELPELMQSILNASIKATTRNLIQFQLHTMVRPSEAAGAMWCEFDLEKAIWTIPKERMKKKRPHIVPLTHQIIKILNSMKHISGKSKYVFCGDRDKNKPANPSTANTALKRMGYGGKLVAHGMRSLASTVLNDHGFDSDLIETALSHIDKDETRSAYNRATYLERRKKLMQWWSDYINKALVTGLNSNKNGLYIVKSG